MIKLQSHPIIKVLLWCELHCPSMWRKILHSRLWPYLQHIVLEREIMLKWILWATTKFYELSSSIFIKTQSSKTWINWEEANRTSPINLLRGGTRCTFSDLWLYSVPTINSMSFSTEQQVLWTVSALESRSSGHVGCEISSITRALESAHFSFSNAIHSFIRWSAC